LQLKQSIPRTVPLAWSWSTWTAGVAGGNGTYVVSPVMTNGTPNTVGWPVAAPSGTTAVTLRPAADLGSTSSRPPLWELKRTVVTLLRWRPEIWTFEVLAALRMPWHEY